MTSSNDATSLSLSGLRHRCAQESDRFFKRQSFDPAFCYELFRRAVLQHDQHAWELVYAQYQPLVAGWVERHPLFQAVEEETQFYVNWAFEKMWSVLKPEKFIHFPDLKSILRYLQMCVHSVMVDSMRTAERAELVKETEDDLEPDGQPLHPAEGVEEHLIRKAQADDLWRILQDQFKSEKERKMVYGSYVLALKPAEILEHYPGTFRDVKDIYLVKENWLARVKRDDRLKLFFKDA